jgi:hypothetical protein
LSRALALAVVALAPLAAAAPGAAQTTCRPNALGAVDCREFVPPPKPRPPYRSTVQGLDRVQEFPPSGETNPEFIPARRTRGLGTILPDPGTGPGLCRPDALGNLVCR